MNIVGKMFSLIVVTEALGKVTGWTVATSLQLAHYSNTLSVILLANQVARRHSSLFKGLVPNRLIEARAALEIPFVLQRWRDKVTMS